LQSEKNMVVKSLLVAAVVLGAGTLSLDAQAGDPLAGAFVGGTIGAVVGGGPGAAVGAVIGSAVAASTPPYYGY